MNNYRLWIQYDGTRYEGWQRQGHTDNTIQSKLEAVLGRMLQHPVELHGSGRTDAGAHASGQIANFWCQETLCAETVWKYLNQYLPRDIAVTKVEPAPERFHSRLSAKGKRYVYRIWNSPVPNVFEARFLWQIQEDLDLEAMRRGASILVGIHDFKAFCANRHMKKSTVRCVSGITVEAIGPEIRLTLEGDGFLYNMVRIIVGTLLEVGRGQRSPEDLRDILAGRDRQQAGITAPAQGLCLTEVYYE